MAQNGVTLNVEFVTVEKAQKFLDSMLTNRKRREDKISQFTDDMLNNRWMMNAAPILIDRNGNMMDGAHRCGAIIRSGIGQKMVVARGVDPAARSTVDIGTKRTLGDELRMCGERNYKCLSAALSWLWRHLNDRMMDVNTCVGTVEGLKILEEHPDLRESVSKSLAVASITSCSLVALVHYIASKTDEIMADLFLDGLITGLDCEPSDPVYKLRNRLIKNRAMKAKLSGNDVAALLIKAWNATLLGTKPKFLKHTSRGDVREPLPRFADPRV